VQIDLDELEKNKKQKKSPFERWQDLSAHHEPIGPIGLLGAEKSPVSNPPAD